MQVKTNKTKVSIKDFYCLSTEDYETLMEEGQVTVKGITITKKDTDVYMIPDELASSTNDGYMSKEDKSKLDAIDPTSVPVNDVKVNDVSVVTAGVANVTVPTDYVNLSTNQEIDGVKTFVERPLFRQIYKKIEYIQASGTTSAFPYIRTLVKRGAEYGETESLSCILDGYFTETQTQGYCGYDGGGQLGQRNGYWSTEGGNSTVSALTRSTILQVINFNSGYDKLYKDGEQIATRGVSTALSYSAQSDYSLFVAYNGRYSYQPCTSLRLYSFKMYAGDYFNSPDTCVLIRDFIPILDIGGSPCLLDLVSNKVFTNQGLGSFVGGDEIGTISVGSQLLTSSDVSPVALTNDYNSLDNKPVLGDAASRSYTSSVTSGNMNLVTSGGVYTAINNLSNSLATVATSGSYNDLSDTPTIPAISGTNDGTNWTTITINNDTYSIGGGSGTITDVEVNGASVVTDGVAEINLADVATSGSYEDLEDTPTIPKIILVELG